MTQAMWIAIGIIVAAQIGAIAAGVFWKRWRLRRVVWSNLNAAYANGYFEPGEQCHDITAEDLAYDMVCYASDCEDFAPYELLPSVRTWLSWKGL